MEQIKSEIKLIKPNLAGYQNNILYNKERFTVTLASTKVGKTFSHMYWLYEISQGGNPIWYTESVKEGWEFWWVAPVYSQAEIAFNRMSRKVKGTGLYRINKSQLFIETPYGTIIRFKTADKPDNLYGEDVYAAVFDEFTRAKPDAWYALYSTLTFTNAPCKLIGNYTGAMNWGTKLGEKSKELNSEYASFKINAWDAVKAGILDEKVVQDAKNDLPENVFNALYLAQGSIDENRIFEVDGIQDLFTNDFVEEGLSYITADIAAYGSDSFILGIWSGLRLKEIIVREKIEPDEITELIKAEAEKHNVPRSRIVYDSDGLGTYLRGYLKGAKPFINGSKALNNENYINLRSQCYFKLSEVVNNFLLFIESNLYKDKIQEELDATKKDKETSAGKLKIISKDTIKVMIRRSPDFADMLMMRMYFELKPPKKKSKTRGSAW